jgi:hypothetical protein
VLRRNRSEDGIYAFVSAIIGGMVAMLFFYLGILGLGKVLEICRSTRRSRPRRRKG